MYTKNQISVADSVISDADQRIGDGDCAISDADLVLIHYSYYFKGFRLLFYTSTTDIFIRKSIGSINVFSNFVTIDWKIQTYDKNIPITCIQSIGRIG